MAVTLAQAAKQETSPLKKAILEYLLRQKGVMAIIPFEPATALQNVVLRWASLPTAGFRKVNGDYEEGTGDTEQIEEGIYLLGGDVDVDKIFDKVQNFIEDPATTQTKMKLKATASVFNDYFINGSPDYDADGFYGLAYRVDNLDDRQKVCIGSEGTPYDPTASAAAEHALIDALHELDDLVGGASAFFCNRDVRLGIASVLRRAGVLNQSMDQYDRQVFNWNGAEIVDVGKQRDLSTEIIPNDEDPGDGGSDTTSIYAVRWGTDDALTGIQVEPLKAYWIGGENHELEAKPARRLRIDWPVGLAGFGKYYAARVYNLAAPSTWT
jgi:hypothetical protein